MKIILFLLLLITCFAFNNLPRTENSVSISDYYYVLNLMQPYKRKNEKRIIKCIFRYSFRYGHDPKLIARLLKRESDFRYWRISSKNARGIAQIKSCWNKILPELDNGKLGKKLKKIPKSEWYKYWYRIGYNIEGSCKILRKHVDEFGGYPLALLCYNRGRNDKSFLLAKKYPFLTKEFSYVTEILEINE